MRTVQKQQHFAGVIQLDKTGSKKFIKLTAERYFQHFVNMNFKVGDKISVFVTSKKPKRSLAQNNYLFGVYYPLIMHETGEQDILRLHERFARSFLLTGEWVDGNGKIYYTRKSSAGLSIGEFCDYIINIYQETGVKPPPTENYQLAPLHEHKKEGAIT